MYRALIVLAEESDDIQVEFEDRRQGCRRRILRSDKLLLRVEGGKRSGAVAEETEEALSGVGIGPDGWRVEGAEEKYGIRDMDAVEHHDTLFYKERWDPTQLPGSETLSRG